MDKKKLLIILGVIGLVLVCAGAVMGGSPSSIPSMFSEANPPEGILNPADVKTSDVHAIELNLVNSNLTIKTGKQFDLSGTGVYGSYVKDGVYYAGADDTKYAANIFGLKISVPAKWVCGHGSYVLTIPEKAKLDSITIRTSYSDVAADTLQAANLTISMKYGNLIINHATADTASVSVKHGNVNIQNALIASSGEIKASKKITIGSETSIENSLNSVSLTSSWGDISLMGEVLGSSQIQTNRGDATLTLPGSSANYGLTTQAGDLNISPTAGSETSTEHFADISFDCKHGAASVNFQ